MYNGQENSGNKSVNWKVLFYWKKNSETTPPWLRYTYHRDKMIHLLTEHWHNQSQKKSVEEDKNFSRKCTKPTYVHRLLEKSSHNTDISYNFTANRDWSTIHQEVDERKPWSLNWPDFDIKQPSWRCKTKHHWAMLKMSLDI